METNKPLVISYRAVPGQETILSMLDINPSGSSVRALAIVQRLLEIESPALLEKIPALVEKIPAGILRITPETPGSILSRYCPEILLDLSESQVILLEIMVLSAKRKSVSK
jgi:hypothetical protein